MKDFNTDFIINICNKITGINVEFRYETNVNKLTRIIKDRTTIDLIFSNKRVDVCITHEHKIMPC